MTKVKRLPGPPVRTTKLKLLKGVSLGHGQDGEEGEIYELPKYFATELVSLKLAEYTDEGDPLQHDETPPGDKDAIPTATIERPTSRDPKPQKRG